MNLPTTVFVGVCSFSSRIIANFHLAEIQTTFYNIPQEKTVERWRNKVHDGFVFSFKVFQGITHNVKSPTWRRFRGKIGEEIAPKLGDLKLNEITVGYWEEMFKISKILSSKFMVVQTAASFKPTDTNIRNADATFSFLNEKISSIGLDTFVAWEPRGAWWKDRKILEEITTKFSKMIIVADPLVVEPLVNGDTIYFRLHGIPHLNYRYKYTESDFAKLIGVIENLESHDVKRFFVLFNNVYMAEDATKFKNILGEKGWKVY